MCVQIVLHEPNLFRLQQGYSYRLAKLCVIYAHCGGTSAICFPVKCSITASAAPGPFRS